MPKVFTSKAWCFSHEVNSPVGIARPWTPCYRMSERARPESCSHFRKRKKRANTFQGIFRKSVLVVVHELLLQFPMVAVVFTSINVNVKWFQTKLKFNHMFVMRLLGFVPLNIPGLMRTAILLNIPALIMRHSETYQCIATFQITLRHSVLQVGGWDVSNMML